MHSTACRGVGGRAGSGFRFRLYRFSRLALLRHIGLVYKRELQGYVRGLSCLFQDWASRFSDSQDDVSLPGPCEVYGGALGNRNRAYSTGIRREGGVTGTFGLFLPVYNWPLYDPPRPNRRRSPVRYSAVGCVIAAAAFAFAAVFAETYAKANAAAAAMTQPTACQ